MLTRGPKKGGNPATTVTPGILVITNEGEEPSMKNLEEYPPWLTGLLKPRFKLKQRAALTFTHDSELAELDYSELRTSLR